LALPALAGLGCCWLEGVVCASSSGELGLLRLGSPFVCSAMLVGFGSGLRFFFSFFFNCGYAKFLSIMGLGSEKMAPNHDYTFNAHYLVLLQHWESCCLLGGIRRFVLSGQLLWGFSSWFLSFVL